MPQVVAGTFTGTGVSGVFTLPGDDKPTPTRFNLNLTFVGTATVQLQRTPDEVTWFVVKSYVNSVSEIGEEIEPGMRYRLECTAHTDNVTYRLSR